jgi:hypothetical protein
MHIDCTVKYICFDLKRLPHLLGTVRYKSGDIVVPDCGERICAITYILFDCLLILIIGLDLPVCVNPSTYRQL